MIQLHNLVKNYGHFQAVKGVSLEVQKGEILGFLGPNGAGKTTTMRMLTGVIPPTSGTATIDGFDIFDSPLHVKQRIGYLPETPPLYFDFTVKSYLEFVMKIKQVPNVDRKQNLTWAIEKCGLVDVQKRLIGNLSKGYKQRVGLAGAIINKPKVLILDEPTVGLDPKQIREIRSMIQELSQEHTIILSTHILPEVAMICDRAAIIYQGKIVMNDVIANITKEKSLEEVFIEIISKEGAES
ncbi:MAG: ABC transporter ATP-binding protein [Bdellovibrionales bacterium]|nr:ABC transporter ATP-binding protein [Bdellovibrionales bacterium]